MSASRLIKLFFTALIIYVCIAMHIVLPTPGGVGLYLSANILGWIFISIFLGVGLWQVAIKKQLLVSKFKLLLGISIFLLCIPFLYGNSVDYFAIPRILTMMAGFLLLLLLTQFQFTAKQKISLLICLLCGVFIEAVIGIVQLFILIPFDIQILGYTPLFGRPYGAFTQPNVMASFMATGIALSLYLLLPLSVKALFTLTDSKQSKSKKIVAIKKYFNYFIFLCLFFCALLLVTLQSKTGYLASILVLLLFIPSFIKNKQTYLRPFIVILVGIIAGILSMQLSQQVDRGNSLYQDMHRSTMYKISGEMFIEKPLLGYGYGNFRKSYREFHLEKMKTNEELSTPLDITHPHNEILFWAVEGGIASLLGLFLFSYAYISLFKGQSISTILPLMMLITPILVHTQTEFPFYHSIIHFIYFIIFIWLAEQQTSHYNIVKLNSSNLFKGLAITIPLFTSIFMLTTLHTSIKMEQLKVNNYKNITDFNSIINVIAWQDHVEVTLQTALLKKGFEKNNPQALLGYIRWGYEFAKHIPNKNLYQNMILAIQTLESNNITVDSKLKDDIYKEAIRLYPSFLKE